MKEKSIIRVEHLTTGYGQTVVMEDISFEVNRGEIFGILGGSGCGKSTVLKNMIGLTSPFSGRIWIDEDDIVLAEGKKKIKIWNRIGVMYQQSALFGSMSLLENIRLPLEEFTNLPLPIMNEIAMTKLKMVGLFPFAHLYPAELSGGMKKRAAIARAMAMDPEILFLDEPSAGLDPITSVELDHLIIRLSRTLGVTFVIVTHELPSVFTMADRVIVLDKSKKGIIAEGKPKDLKEKSKDPFVKQFFNRIPQESSPL
ncbi:ATP-binding cassette domain-containing protein [Leptospira sp. 2 VSF19]|uniref:ATP-binding cassette domain-containing protein n=1 Tax=Leptospira soteropolitanensis TaxID=2950025 RepID=A0AAW5VRH6_9LEPT|nr:ATP-binding cassette domain-containing protein [Leptospira soteropolitanensis]MCW7494265.1 ATP-binding cassette domain-containing protein [Leptospira soteropolitanensis]MCW7501760.1 ATP-binding cassette domain-containing protein [Leptospira soteropolitanensis]MCW7524111.1 ATP-binding cassette domain-containing protein [Leptospira soteropolitanensis]MCW7527976.1 ATP-binding cassette domain-containing protein [Leptospira soteropolitanensis]MCW7531730.1 ATP-binding cassette domain-containing p